MSNGFTTETPEALQKAFEQLPKELQQRALAATEGLDSISQITAVIHAIAMIGQQKVQ